MEVFNVRLPRSSRASEIKIVCAGCVHYGASGCDEKLADFWYDYVAKSPDTYLILGGDLVDGITEKDKRYLEEEVARWCFDPKWGGTVADRQYHYAAAKWKKLAQAGKILWLHTGNHEMALKRYASRDLTLDWSRELKIPYAGYSALINLLVARPSGQSGGGYCVRVYSTHGNGSAQTDGAVMNTVARMLQQYDVDAALMWHLHRKMHIAPRVLGPSKPKGNLRPAIRVKDRIAAVCGTFLCGQTPGVTSYAEVKGHRPVPLGPSVLHLKETIVQNPERKQKGTAQQATYMRLWISDAVRL